jgi:hypothetical protein
MITGVRAYALMDRTSPEAIDVSYAATMQMTRSRR